MKNLIYFLPFIFLMSCSEKKVDPNTEEWRALFNGNDLNDWQVKIKGYDLNDNFGETFYVEDGTMKVKYDAYETFDSRFGHIFYKDKFSYYRLKVEYRFTGEQVPGGEGWALRNSGAMIHSQSAGSMLKDQDFPICIEAQFLGGDGTEERPTGNLCTPSTHVFMADTLFTNHCIYSKSKTYHGDQWVSIELHVFGDSLIQHFVEGEKVLEYTKPQYGGLEVTEFDGSVKKDGDPVTEGYIALQSESHPIEFRKVELLDLCGCMDKKALNYKSYFVKNDKEKCIY
ncbi:MAG: DUF1080 domain-containing protein [Saprospiraceae bacterium]